MVRFCSVLLASVAITACSGPRKAQSKAEGLIKRAIRIYPDVLRMDTLRTTIPGDSAKGNSSFALDHDADSLLAVTRQLTEALESERALYLQALTNLGNETGRYALTDPAPAPPRTLGPASQAAARQLRDRLCTFQPVVFEDSTLLLLISVDADGIDWTLKRKPQQVATPVQRIQITDAPEPTWWQQLGERVATAFWYLVAFALGYTFRALKR